jgi:hypothetical protein
LILGSDRFVEGCILNPGTRHEIQIPMQEGISVQSQSRVKSLNSGLIYTLAVPARLSAERVVHRLWNFPQSILNDRLCFRAGNV